MDSPDTHKPTPEPSPNGQLTTNEVVQNGAFRAQNMLAQFTVDLLGQAIEINDREKRELTEAHDKELVALGQKHAEREASLRAEAYTDELTGLPNYKALKKAYESLCAYHQLSYRGAAPQAVDRRQPVNPEQSDRVIFYDLDGFKEVNDKDKSHANGDKLLRRFADILTANGRIYDTAFRVGGDEFAMILIGVTEKRAREIAQAVRQETADTGQVTVSIGIADADSDQEFEQFMVKADTAMYQAKAAGKNRIVVFKDKASAA